MRTIRMDVIQNHLTEEELQKYTLGLERFFEEHHITEFQALILLKLFILAIEDEMNIKGFEIVNEQKNR